MPEFFLPFLIGYATCRILSFILSSGRETSSAPGLVLKWDKDVMAWRPCSSIDDINSRYLLARTIDKEALKYLKNE